MKKHLVPTSINGIEFDALISQNKTYEAEIPDYPVETGYSVSDHITLRPVQLSLELYLSPTPVTWIGRHGSGHGRVERVCERLEQMFFEKELVTIETTDEIYTDMGITSLSIADSRESGYTKKITCMARKVYVTSTDSVDIPSGIAQSGATGLNAGIASTSKTSPNASSASDVDEKEESKTGQSILYGIAAGLNFV